VDAHLFPRRSGSPITGARRGRRLNSALVNDDPIRTLLTSVEPSGFIDRTPGTVALLRSRVEAAGGDPDAVALWVEAHGGHLDRTPRYLRRGLGPRPRQSESSGQEFYVVPTEALAQAS